MRRILDDVVPVGTPWGGPESRRCLSGFVSMRMQIEGIGGGEEECHQAHERMYHLFLGVSGIAISTIWNERLAPFSHDRWVEEVFGDTIPRVMAYAGYRYSVVEKGEIRADPEAVLRTVAASIERGAPVLACSDAFEWSVMTGYNDEESMLYGWDGAGGYWGRPALPPDGYHENGMFAAANWPETVSRFVFVEGKAPPRSSSVEVIRRMVAVLEEQRSHDYGRAMMERLRDDRAIATMEHDVLHDFWEYLDGFVGWHAENRCFAGFALSEILPEMEDVKGNPAAVAALRSAGGPMSETHDVCWEAWRILRARHHCDLPVDRPCRQCGGCLRPAEAEDIEAFRAVGPRRKLDEYLAIIDRNDAKLLEALRGTGF